MQSDVFALSSTFVDVLAEQRPSWATLWGVAGHEDRWEDLSPSGEAKRQQAVEQIRDSAATLPTPQTDDERLATLVLQDHLALELDALHENDATLDLNILASPVQMLLMALDAMPKQTAVQKRMISNRLRDMRGALEGYAETLAVGLDTSGGVAKRQVIAVVEQARAHASEESSLLRLAREIEDEAAGIQAAGAYGWLADWLENKYLPETRTEDAVGEQRYQRAARRFVGADVDLAQTYAWGWQQVAEIAEHMRELAAELHPGATVAEALKAVRNDPALCSRNRASFIEAMQKRQRFALSAVESDFDISVALRALDVKLTPPGGAPGAYYVSPSEDLKRPGCIWYSIPAEGPVPLYDQISTAYHEGFPGHHLQCGLQVALKDRLSRLHRVVYGYSGFAEGWALYAEQRMDELGHYEHPAYRLGMWSNQMARACRVVVDIGLHTGRTIPTDAIFHPGEAWSFELAVEMMHRWGGLDPVRSASEVTRYLGWPGQAISYKVGQRAMLQLRDRWIREISPDLRSFHSKVLNTGNVALGVLEELVLAPSRQS